MGFFSFRTADTKESISSRYSQRGADTVYFLQPNGKPNVVESNYEGYGVFGRIDVFEWLAKMNGVGEDRQSGIDLYFSEDGIKYPLKFSFDRNARYEDLNASEDCPAQGFFYDECNDGLD